ncbi:MAG: hypothetical protein JWP01_3985 [Myxococcales bacterium]|nr:hypothetical protein [Myxococcales bacterium]
MQLSERTAGLMRSLCEPVYFVRDPLERIDHVVGLALSDLDEYIAALDQALASNVALANLGPEYHPEVIVRRFLAEVRRRLDQLMN